MAKTETVTVELPEELMASVRGAVEGGEYGSSDAVVAEALMDWSVRRGGDDVAWLREKWEEAVTDERPHVPVDEVFDRLRARYAAMIPVAAEK